MPGDVDVPVGEKPVWFLSDQKDRVGSVAMGKVPQLIKVGARLRNWSLHDTSLRILGRCSFAQLKAASFPISLSRFSAHNS